MDESYVGKKCFYADRITNDKTYNNRELGVCIQESLDDDNCHIMCWFETPFLGVNRLDKRYVSVGEYHPKKEQMMNYIKYWLQAFGERDNESFFIENLKIDGKFWDLSLDYNYCEDGVYYGESRDCCGDFNNDYIRKLVPSKGLSYRNIDELEKIILKLKSIKEYY